MVSPSNLRSINGGFQHEKRMRTRVLAMPQKAILCAVYARTGCSNQIAHAPYELRESAPSLKPSLDARVPEGIDILHSARVVEQHIGWHAEVVFVEPKRLPQETFSN